MTDEDVPIRRHCATSEVHRQLLSVDPDYREARSEIENIAEAFQRERSRVAKEIDEASGLLWQEGCVGPKVTEGFFNMNGVEEGFPNWQKANRNWAARAARGTGVRGTSKGTRTSYFYTNGFAPFGRSWGAPFAPTKKCPIGPPPCDPLATADPVTGEVTTSSPAPARRPSASPARGCRPRSRRSPRR